MKQSTSASPPASGFTRRKFLQGSGAAAAATVLATTGGEALADHHGDEVIAGETTITLHVNGQNRQAVVEPRTTLLEVLRYQFELTGAKPVSADGSSGASTVLIDGKPMMASTLLALSVRDKKIETVESVSQRNSGAVPAAFVEYDAQQCGFCTPGFVVAVRAFLDKNPNASEAEIRAGLNGNVCRCGTYANVLQAVIALVKGGPRG
ncbi:MAG: (2Fe-2S)-binding protein [Planctomycetota bacterium]|nr:MAG: (2Fe-2S)-binding protein [Planctomycetota bacterium]REJ97411.1 MAG: (2Fe-2S)-binding protein [Planctomycetota bacterium]REK27677.1 MAG: (2Fe-2S)-binding protein [Planctomycetota bacterium]REK38480.1 MAG: (2Fe-2S)-binding protein [Planctomycetota bacterium]